MSQLTKSLFLVFFDRIVFGILILGTAYSTVTNNTKSGGFASLPDALECIKSSQILLPSIDDYVVLPLFSEDDNTVYNGRKKLWERDVIFFYFFWFKMDVFR